MKRAEKKLFTLCGSLINELDKSLEYFFDERPIVGVAKINRTEERKQNSKTIISLCDEIGELTKLGEDVYEQAKINI